MFVLQPKADHQGNKLLFTEARCIEPYYIEKFSPNKKHLVGETGTEKTQVLYRMRLLQFTSRQPVPDVQLTPPEKKPDLAITIIDDDLYARAWECEYEKPIFDIDHDNSPIPK